MDLDPSILPFARKRTRIFRSASSKKNRKKIQGKPPKGSKKIWQAIKALSQQTLPPVNTHIVWTSGNVDTASANVCVYKDFEVGTRSDFTDATTGLFNRLVMLGQSDAGTVREETYNSDTGNYGHRLNIIKAQLEVLLQNHQEYSAMVSLYWCKPKFHHNSAAKSTITTGLDDRSGGDNGWETAVSFYPQHSEQFLDMWQIIKSQNIVMKPGDQFNAKVYGGKGIVRRNYLDSHTDQYLPSTSTTLVVRVQGQAGEDTGANKSGFTQATLTYITKATYVYRQLRRPVLMRWSHDTSDLAAPEQVMHGDEPHLQVGL